MKIKIKPAEAIYAIYSLNLGLRNKSNPSIIKAKEPTSISGISKSKLLLF